MNRSINRNVSLQFPLDVEDGWPPVALESLPFKTVDRGFIALTVPLFVKDLSCGDIINAECDGDYVVNSWSHVERSKNTTVWLLRIEENNQIDNVLFELREIGCNTTGLSEYGCYSIDVPGSVEMASVDSILEKLNSDAVAVAFPSMRHPE